MIMKVLAIASAGGHWVQLLRLRPAFDGTDIIFVCTKPSFADTVRGYEFHCLPDSNRNNKLSLIKTALGAMKLVYSIKPDVIITTGAAPGLIGLIAGRLIGSKTIWIDSIANVEKLSMSGFIASKIAHKVYTQWEHLMNERVIYSESVLA
jgi:UDP-N-acetylglucosamine:LPS N-acetylglucosamine transferase